MKNQEIANIFYEIADYLDMESVAFRPFAYRRAADVLMGLEESTEDIYKKSGLEGLEKIAGVGEHIALKIEEYIKTGKIKYYRDLKKKTPVKIEELLRVEGVGPKTIKTLYQKLKVRNLKDLEKAAKEHRIAPLFGFGKKTEENILQSIGFLKKTAGRFLLGTILSQAEEFFTRLKKMPEVKKIDMAGSLRRMRETIGDIDFLAFSQKPEKVMKYFVSMPEVVKVWGKGKTKASVKTRGGFNMDIRIVPQKSYGSALQHFTGSKEHNIALRRIAIERGLKVNEYGVFRGKKMVAGKTEQEVYKILKMDWIPPEMRENKGEIELAMKGKLPKLIDYKDIKGDLHCHSTWSGGEQSIEEMAQKAMELGYQYIGISDHTKFLRIEKGINEKQLRDQRKEIDKLNSKLKKITILQGCEANIMADGSIDINDKALEALDFVIAGVHSLFKMDNKKMTERMIRAMKNPHVDIISHPTGRLIGRRDEYAINFDKILKVAAETGTTLEINAFPQRLDLKDSDIMRAKEAGVKMVINTDAHQKNQMEFMNLGIAQARRGWAEKKDIVNAWPLEKFLKKMK